MTVVEQIATALHIPPSGVWSLLAVGGFLLIPTAHRLVNVRRPGSTTTRKSVLRLRSWWILLALLLVVLALGRSAVVVVMLAISILALRESLRLAASFDRYPWFVALSIALYLWAWLDGLTPFLRWLPFLILALAAVEVVRHLSAGATAEARSTRDVPLALLSSVLGPSYAVGVASLPAPEPAPDVGLGWLVLLLVLTGVHDSAQAWWGRTFGSRPLAPVLSPNKTWEGLWGGLATTATVAVLVGPTLTPFGRMPLPGSTAVPPWLSAAGLGVIIGLAGTGGDLAASALKRRAGVDDSGDLVPGHGGVLDRFDSLAATAPVFFLLCHFIWFQG